MPIPGVCSNLLLCAQQALSRHPMRTAALSGVVILAVFFVSLLALVRGIFAANELPLLTPIERDYPDDATARFEQRLNDSVHRAPKKWSLPLKTRGRDIIGADGRKVHLHSVNWYGASDKHQIPGGLNVQHRDDIARAIRQMGFNSVRLPYSDQMVRDNPIVNNTNVEANPDLKDLPVLDVFIAVTKSLTAAGLAVIINNHITESRWCCDGNPCDLQWSNDWLGPWCKVRQTEDDWISHWTSVMRRLVDDPLVVGVDLRNEPRGLFGASGWQRWAQAATRCANRLHELQQDWLIVVEGTGSANHLHHVRRNPVVLRTRDKLVYSAHVYGWHGWGAGRPYWTRSYADFAADMHKNWAFLLADDTAPVWLAEFGAPRKPNRGDVAYWHHLLRFMRETGARDFAYWAWNPVADYNGGNETYGLVRKDWVTPRRDYRLFDLLEFMADENEDAIDADVDVAAGSRAFAKQFHG